MSKKSNLLLFGKVLVGWFLYQNFSINAEKN